MNGQFRRAVWVCLFAGSVASLAGAGEHDSPSILGRAAATGKAKTFVTAVYMGRLVDTLRDGGPFTIFVPTDDAFNRIPEADLIDLLQPENEAKLAKILTYHVVQGRIPASEITHKPQLKTVEGGKLTIAANARGVAVNGATIVQTDLFGRNGVVHLIDRVLMPPADDILTTARKSGQFRLLLEALEITGLDAALSSDGPFTVFAPTDEALRSLGHDWNDLLKDRAKLTEVLKYHVLPGAFSSKELLGEHLPATLLGKPLRFSKTRTVFYRVNGIPMVKLDNTVDGEGTILVNEIPVIKKDIKVANGVIHIIDSVLIPGGNRSVITTAEKAGQFKTLLKALEVAGLTDVLREKGPFTVLAPTDEAFAMLGEHELAALLKDKHRLADVLKLHVIAGQVKARDLAAGIGLKTLQGETLKSSIVKGRLLINEYTVIDSDIDAGNGIIQVIDRVLIPSH